MHASVLLTLAVIQIPRLGTVSFPTSGAPDAQPSFIRGVLYLHSFEYESAAASFRAAQREDSTFTMAYWGEAMTYTHPVWNQQDSTRARAVLARAPRAPTARENAYLDAARVLYGSGAKARRDTLYADAMRRLADAFPDDAEARAFYALALLGLNQGVRDTSTYRRAAEVAAPIFRANPQHPGAAHYLIHAYDDPAHAHLGLDAARAYSKIAPDAAHAQHMTTHIFLALGMWDEVVSQNEVASGPHRDHWAPNHYTAWLGYGLLQQGRLADARRHLETARTNLPPRAAPGARAYLMTMRAHYLINSRHWIDPATAWDIDREGVGAIAVAIDAFALGYAAVQRGDAAEGRRRLADLAATAGMSPERVPTILALELEAALLIDAGKTAQALPLLLQANGLEDAMPVDYGPPDVVKPSHELTGEAYMRLNQPAAAQRRFSRALELAPKRASSLLWLWRAASRAGDDAVARQARTDLLAIWHAADAQLLRLEELSVQR